MLETEEFGQLCLRIFKKEKQKTGYVFITVCLQEIFLFVSELHVCKM